MPSVDILSLANEKRGTLELDERLFGLEVKPGLAHEVVLMQRANQRQGTASTKTRGEVRGGGKKPWRQKGTGRARHGSIRSPIWRGGGTVFGPRPRDYTYHLPKKKVRVSLLTVLSAKLRDGALKVVEGFSLPEPKTKTLVSILKGLQLQTKTLILVGSPSPFLEQAARNLPHVTVQSLERLNVYDVLRHQNLLIQKQDLETLQQRLLSLRLTNGHRGSREA